MKRKRLNDEEKSRVLEYRKEGLAIEKIAEILSVGTSTIHRLTKKHNVNKRVDGISEDDEKNIFNYLNDGYSIPEISELLNFAGSSINKFLKRNNFIKLGRSYSTGLSKDQENKILNLIELGYGKVEIAKNLNISKSYVITFCRNLNIKSKFYKLTPDIKSQIFDLKKQGLNSAEIGKALNINRNSISKWARQRNNSFKRSKELTPQEQIEKEECKKLRKTFSKAIHRVLYERDIKDIDKYHSISNYLPYTVRELKEHLEKQFETWMSWDNWGVYSPKLWNDSDITTWRWHIDHIIPVSEFKYTKMEDEDFKKCWALENLRPLNAKQNVSDGAKKIRHFKKAINTNIINSIDILKA